MAEPIGIASGLVALTTFAFQSTIALCKTVRSFRSHPRDVRDLLQQLDVLGGVLDSLQQTIQNIADLDLSPLENPLRRCGNACQEFEQELLKCVSQSGGDRLTFRGWTRLKYLGDDVDSFRQSLATYTATINVALADANLRRSSATAGQLEEYRILVENATQDLEAHLEKIDDKIGSLLRNTVPNSVTANTDIGIIKEERTVTQKCLEICANLSEHISRLKVVPGDGVPASLTNDSLQECKAQLFTATTKLEEHMKEILGRLVSDSDMNPARSNIARDLVRLQEEWETAHQCRRICDTMGENLDKSISTIENFGTGDSLQFMVSTNGQVLHGRNQGQGWRNRQIGGHLSDESVQQLSRDMASIDMARISTGSPPSQESDKSPSANIGSGHAEFGARHGPGIKLKQQSTSPPLPQGR